MATCARDSAERVQTIRGILFDLDGVLYVGSQPIAGAADVIGAMREKGLACRFVTNTSTMSLASLHEKLLALGLPVEPREIISAPQAALRYLKQQPGARCCLLMAEDARRDFAGLPQVSLAEADIIVLGDIGDDLGYHQVDRIFNRMMQGARLIAVHRNRFWQTERGLRMDIGGCVAALEYCTGQQALVMGKPSPDFFRIALNDMGLNAGEAAIVGDDIDADIGGGQQAGLLGILVRTGKFRQSLLDSSPVCPDYVIDSVRDLPGLPLFSLRVRDSSGGTVIGKG